MNFDIGNWFLEGWKAFFEMMSPWWPNAADISEDILNSLIETLVMTGVTAVIAGLIGMFFGVILVVTAPNGILPNRILFQIIDKAVNIFRSIPFVILLTLVLPLTRLLVNTSIGTAAAIVPLIVATIPFYARQVQLALVEVDSGVVEAAQAMGCSPLEIIFRVYLREGLPSLIRVSANTIISLIGLTTMAGAVGGGGLGYLAISRGYNRFQTDIIIVATGLTLLIVFISQWIGGWLEKKATH